MVRRQEEFTRAFAAAQEHEQLSRNAGIESVPAVSAFLLAKEAVVHALAAYRQAGADGPPNADHWKLRDARQLLEELGEPVPDLPAIDPATVKVPLGDELRAFIAVLKARRREQDLPG